MPRPQRGAALGPVFVSHRLLRDDLHEHVVVQTRLGDGGARGSRGAARDDRGADRDADERREHEHERDVR